jgi:hypothetical protein
MPIQMHCRIRSPNDICGLFRIMSHISDPGHNQVIPVKLCQKPTDSSESSSASSAQAPLDQEILRLLSKLFNGLKDASSIALEKSPLTVAWWKEESAGWTKPVYFLCLGRADLENPVRQEKKQIDQGTFDMLSKGLHRGLKKWQVERSGVLDDDHRVRRKLQSALGDGKSVD